MKRLTIFLLVALMLVSATGCGANPPAYTLRVTLENWDGWEADLAESDQGPVVYEYKVEKGKAYPLPGCLLENSYLCIKKLREGEVTIQVSEGLVPSPWSPNGPEMDTFTLRPGEILQLVTATTDAGTNVEIELVESQQ